MDDVDGYIEYTDVPEEFRAAGHSLNNFTQVNYEAARAALAGRQLTAADIANYKGKILDIIRGNPPLGSVPKYLQDGREDFLWYSDFYDEISKEAYHKYRIFAKPATEITPANYAAELAKVELPYFKELIDLVSLERLCTDYKGYEEKEKGREIGREPESTPGTIISEPKIEPISETSKTELPTEEPSTEAVKPVTAPKPKKKRLSGKRSYEPNLTDKEYTLLVECIEAIRLFRRPVKVAELRKLFTGKLQEPLEVANQKSLVYLFDQLRENTCIKRSWISIADKNQDFLSFRSEGNRQRYGDKPHFITMQQFLNNRNRNQREYIHGLDTIDDMMELINENRVE